MAIYGGSNKNLFTILPTNANKVTGNNPTISSLLSKNKYNVQVNDQTKVAQIYKQGELGPLGIQGPDVSVGTVNLTTGKFTPDANRKLLADSNPSGNVVEAELKYFNSQEGIKQIKGASSITVQKGSLDNGATAAKAQANAQSITGTNVATADANTLAQQQQTAAVGLSTAINLDAGNAVGRNSVGTYGNLFYPLGLENTFQDKIRFTIIEYKPRGLEIGTLTSGGSGSIKGGGSFGSRPTANRLGSVTLPIPGGISDTNTVGWQDNSMNAFQLASANVAMKSIQDGFASGAEALGAAAKTASEGSANQELKDAIAPMFAALAVQGDASALISRTQGAVLNPNLELLFNGPELRSFSFTFKMSARSKPEGDAIVKIIRAFKQSMSAQKSTAQLFIKAPNIYKIEYLHKTNKDNVHKRIGRIKDCALMSFTTNYTPEGQYATYQDGTMVSYEIQMQFKELEPVFNNDYTGPDTEIGF